MNDIDLIGKQGYPEPLLSEAHKMVVKIQEDMLNHIPDNIKCVQDQGENLLKVCEQLHQILNLLNATAKVTESAADATTCLQELDLD